MNSPIPISEQILDLAKELKDRGVVWEPSVGSFVWDPEGRIEASSPFPMRVYFVLSLKRFLQIFKSIEAMKEELVWIPTSFQLISYAKRNLLKLEWEQSQVPEKDVISMYRSALHVLGTSESREKENS
jgi:hypothetical protein